MLDTTIKPHPFLTTNVLYVLNAPPRVKWEHLVATLKSCGKITSMGATKTTGKMRTWSIRFQDIFHAELALALFQGSPVQGLPETAQPHRLLLSHTASSTQEDYETYSQCFPQYIKGLKSHILRDMRAETVFTIFRRAGPLVSVRFDVNIRSDVLACTIQYFKANDAHLAETLVVDTMLEKVRAAKGPIALQTYDPYTLIYAGLPTSFSLADAKRLFSQDVEDIEIYITREAAGNVSCTVTYVLEEQARTAKQSLNTLGILYSQASFSHAEHHDSTPQEFTEDESDKSEPPPAEFKYSFNHEHFQSSKGSDDDMLARQTTLAAAQRTLQEAQCAEDQAEKEHDVATDATYDATTRRLQALEERERVLAELISARTALEKARLAAEKALKYQRIMQDTFDRLEQELTTVELAFQEAEQQEVLISAVYDEAVSKRERAARGVAEAVLAEKAARAAYESIQPGSEDASLHDVGLDEAIRRMAELRAEELGDRQRDKEDTEHREAELQESLRRMEELRAKEQRQVEEERSRKEAEKEERQRREAEAKQAEEQKEQERIRMEEQRKKAFDEARRREQERCRQRDHGLYGSGPWRNWSLEKALERFKLVSEEFDTFIYDEKRPLSFSNIPWPLISDPLPWTVADVEWGGIESFFKEMELMLPWIEYKTLVEQCHRRFHPDKWKARRTLATVSGDEQQQLEAAGNIVAQALTPLWLATKE